MTFKRQTVFCQNGVVPLVFGRDSGNQTLRTHKIRDRGRLKMREWKNRHGRKCRGGKVGSGNICTILQGWKMREWKHRERSILMQDVMLGSAEKRMVRLISREIIFEEFQRISSQSTNVIQTDGRTDGQLIMAIPRYAMHQMGVVSSKIAIFASCGFVSFGML